MAYLQHQDQCEHASCRGHEKVPEGRFGGMVCDCPCHKLTGDERDYFLAAHPGPFARMMQSLRLAPWTKTAHAKT
jgi:hypothetical protein